MVSLTEFEDGTAFERFALESTAALRSTEKRRSAYLDLRTGKGTIFGYAHAALSGGADRLRLDLRPLMFGAAWKVIDLAILHAIGGPLEKTVQTDAKVAKARVAGPPTPFSSHPNAWQAIVQVLEATQELRNGLVHREAKVGADRSLSVKRKKSTQVDTIDADEQLALCRLAQLVARALMSGELDERTIFDISDQLCALTRFSGFTSRVGRDALRVFEVVAALDVADNRTSIDVPQLITATKATFPDATYIDFVGVVDDAGTVLVGALDTADQIVHEVDMAALPSWLHVEKRVDIDR